MLPILRILPVGGVLLAILILVLALKPAGRIARAVELGNRAGAWRAARSRSSARSTRQFLIHAALKRADELNRLRELPDTPARSDNAQPKVASLPSDRSDSRSGRDRHQSTKHRSSAFRWRLANLPRPNCPSLRRGESAPAAKKTEPAAKSQRESAAASIEYACQGAGQTRRHLTRSIFLKCCSAGRSISNPAYGSQQTVQRYQPVPRTSCRAGEPATPFPRCPAPLPTRRIGFQRKSKVRMRAARKTGAAGAAISGSRDDRYKDWMTMQRSRLARTARPSFCSEANLILAARRSGSERVGRRPASLDVIAMPLFLAA